MVLKLVKLYTQALEWKDTKVFPLDFHIVNNSHFEKIL